MSAERAVRLPLMAAACLALAGCGERPLPPDYAEYAGHWRGDGVLLVITPGGHADYERVREGSRTSIEGGVHGFDSRSFRIGPRPLGVRFEVQQPPRLEEGRWRMTVDGHALVRVEIMPVQSGRETLQR